MPIHQRIRPALIAALLYGGATSYLDRILTADFDGVYLDIIDAFDYFEE